MWLTEVNQEKVFLSILCASQRLSRSNVVCTGQRLSSSNLRTAKDLGGPERLILSCLEL